MSPKITKLTVEKSRTVETGKEWRKTIYTVEADVSDIQNEEKLDKLRKDIATKEDDWLAEETTATTTAIEKEGQIQQPEPPIKAEDIPDLDIGEVNDCVWTRYGKNKGPAKPGHAGWTKNPIQFASETFPKALSQLVELIKKSPDGKLVIGNLEYSLSGGDSGEHFIGRKPCSPEKATARKPKASNRIEDLKALFPPDLENLLSFEEAQDHVKVKPRTFLGSENFAKIAAVVRGVGGEYVSAGKQSHFRVPK